MQETIDYNFLIIGRSGAGKSATTKLLTGDPSISVANSLKQVTTQIKFYKGMTIALSQNKNVRFNILDMPGLDKVNNRFIIRDILIEQLKKIKVVLHGIIYVSSLTQRDTVDNMKLFKFIQMLPWPEQYRKSAIIPILTKYDNLMIDSPQEQISSIKQQYGKMFEQAGYSQAWSKRVYWINHTKSLQFKMKINEQIKIVYEKQISRLTEVVKKNKQLSIDSIIKYVEEQGKYVTKQLIQKIKQQSIPWRKQYLEHGIILNIQIHPKKFYQSLTTVSASSIGLAISHLCCKKDLPLSFSLLLTSIPILLAFVNLTNTAQMNEKVIKSKNFENVCKYINLQVQNQWKSLNETLEFITQGKYLFCKHHKTINNYIFLQASKIQLKIQQTQFEKIKQEKMVDVYRIEIPQFEQDIVWVPEVTVKFGIKTFSEDNLLKFIEQRRSQFVSKY